MQYASDNNNPKSLIRTLMRCFPVIGNSALTAPFESSRLESSERQTWAASPGLRLPLRMIKKMH